MKSLYETDHHKWLSEQVGLLANKQFDELDLDNLLEELKLGINDKLRELRRRLATLICYLLKCDYQTTVLKDSCNNYFIKKWMGTIKRTRRDINELIDGNSSLKNYIEDTIVKAYPDGKEDAIGGMNQYSHSKAQLLNENSFPDTCPWSYDQMMVEDWYPLNGLPES
ncbi:DUF29 domain-containing protein [Endozoicomonas sp. 4G]|uniref:DUF29 domain-containing protein n=1 Tax=Endozoicomonas sp. 4G TaxID=2872754 RepID=UPI00207908A4|nr:DUF29 domain-containing protein [Endozoicomonas sp. 4G]